MSSPQYPMHYLVQLDKCNEEWVLTYDVTPGTALRIRIQHSCCDDPDLFICEVIDLPKGCLPAFREVARFGWAPVYLMPEEWDQENVDFTEFPSEWFDEFVKLARVWSAFIYRADFKSASGQLPSSRTITQTDIATLNQPRYHGPDMAPTRWTDSA